MKRLVFCFDGTWNRIDAEYSTNVVITAESVLPLSREGVAQLIYYDEGVSAFVKSARHAVAIDERRKDFAPTLWTNLDSLNKASGFSGKLDEAPYQQVWFPGTHSSVGGGGERRGLSDQALDWILDGARLAGLELDHSNHSRIFELKPDYSSI